MFEQYPSDSFTGKLNSLFNGATSHRKNISSTIKISSEMETSFTTQSTQLAVNEPSTILTTSMFTQEDDERLSVKAAEFLATTIATDTQTSYVTLASATSPQPRPSSTTVAFIEDTVRNATIHIQKQMFTANTTSGGNHLSSTIATPTNFHLPDAATTIDQDNSSLYNKTDNSTNSTKAEFSNETNFNATTVFFPQFTNDSKTRNTDESINLNLSQEIYVCAAILCFTACVGIVGNSLVIRLIVTEINLNMKTHFTNMAILSLASADIISCALVAFPATITMLTANDPTNGFLCGIQCMTNYMTIIAIVGTLAIISIDRLINTVWPLHYHKWITPIRFRTALITLWIQDLIASTHAASHANKVDYEDSWNILCVTNWSSSKDSAAFGIFSLTWFIIVPLTIILGVTGVMLRLLFMGKHECTCPRLGLHRQNAIRGAPPVNSERNNMNMTTVSNTERFRMRTSHNNSDRDEEDREIRLCTRVGHQSSISVESPITYFHRPSNGVETISTVLSNEGARNTDVTTKQILNCYMSVILAYMILQVPTVLLFIVKQSVYNANNAMNKTPGGISYFAVICRVLISALNPFLYGLLRKDFRNSYHAFFKSLRMFCK